MASRYGLCVLLCERQEKIPWAEASTELREQLLFDVNRAYRFVYNASSLSFKTRILEDYEYIPSNVMTVPDDFLSFQDTGLVFLKDGTNVPRKLEYLPWHRMMEFIIGRFSNRVGPPRWYSVGGPSAQDGNVRDFWIAPRPPGIHVFLNLAYQAKPQANGVIDPVEGEISWTEQIIPIPEWLHETAILDVAILFRKMDKGLSLQAQNAILMEGFGQMNTQEPHGREANSMKPRFPSWGGGRRGVGGGYR